MNELNWFEARALARLGGYAIRRDGWRRWLVYRRYGWYFVEFTDAGEVWRVPQSGDMTDVDYQAKDFTTFAWEDATFPACSTPGKPEQLAGNDGGGAQSWGPPAQCGPAIIVGDNGSNGGLDSGTPTFVPVLDYFLLNASLDQFHPPTGVTASRNGFLVVPENYRGGVRLSIKFSDAKTRDSRIDPVKVYCWVRVGAPVPGDDMSAPFAFAADQVSALPNSFGPVLAGRTYDHPSLPGGGQDFSFSYYTTKFTAGVYDPLWPYYYDDEGTPTSVFRAVPMQPGDTVYARIDAYLFDGSHYSFFSQMTIGPWAVQPVVMTITPSITPVPDQVRVSYGVDGVPHEDQPPGTPDDDVYEPYYWSTPAQIDLYISVSVSGGKDGSASVMTITVDDVVRACSGPSGGVYSLNESIVVAIGSTHTYSATWTQAADDRGPAVTHTETGSFTVPPLHP